MEAMILKLDGVGTYPRFLDILKAIIGPGIESQTMIDLCCHVAQMTRTLPFAKSTFVDVVDHAAHFAELGLEFARADVINGAHEVFTRHYDVALCMDGIEHVHKPQGFALVERMLGLADKQAIFTPLDAWMIEPDNSAPESHKCLWQPEDLPGWAHVVLPDWHRAALGIGAFFSWRCADVAQDFERVRAVLV